MKELARREAANTERLRMDLRPPPVKARRKDSRVVKYDDIAGLQKVREVAELAVVKPASFPVKMEHPGTIPGDGWVLSYEFGRKVEVEV
jgi:hypothetical protein